MATTTEELRELLDRVQKATGPDREIDKALLWAVGRFSWRGMNYWSEAGEMWPDRLSTFFTASIDAAVALVERVLPGWSLQMNLSEGLTHPCVVMGRSHPTNKTVAMEHFTLPLAILSAMLSAVLATTEAPAQRGDGTP